MYIVTSKVTFLMSEVSKVPNTVLLMKVSTGHVGGLIGAKHCTLVPIKDQKADCMSEDSKVVFVAFTQHCIQSTVTHVGGVIKC